MSEYARFLEGSERDFAKAQTLAERLHLDVVLLLPMLTIMSTGLFVLFSASDGDWGTVNRQIRNFVVGFAVLLVAAQIRVDTLQRWAPALYLGALLLLLLVPFFGVGAKGAQRWLSLGFIRFQPSEIMKIVMPLMVAAWVVRRALPPRPSTTVTALLIIAVPAAAIAAQPDLGTAILVGASGAFVVFMAGVSWWQIFSGALAALACIWPAWLFMLRDYQKKRILTLFDPEADRLGAGWNIIQSKQPLARAAGPERDICRAPSHTSISCPRVRPTSSSRCWPRSGGYAVCFYCCSFTALLLPEACGSAYRHRPAMGGYWPVRSHSRLGFMWW